MTYTYDDLEKIYYSTAKNWTDKRKIDTLLEIGATLEMELGINSTPEEKQTTRRKQKHIYLTIKKLDRSLGELLMKEEL
jgi:hypothetical protein